MPTSERKADCLLLTNGMKLLLKFTLDYNAAKYWESHHSKYAEITPAFFPTVSLCGKGLLSQL